LSPRPQIDHSRRRAEAARRARARPGEQARGQTTQVTISLGPGASIVPVEQQTYLASVDDRWERGTRVKVGWHPEHCLVLH
jgi:TOBE domain